MKVITRTIFKRLITDSQGLAPEMVGFRNIRINGDTRGCCGWLVYENGAVIYVNTEDSCYGPLQGKILYRRAKDTKDCVGGRNHWIEPDLTKSHRHDYNMIRAFAELAYGKDFETGF